jgi:hypothetical protein
MQYIEDFEDYNLSLTQRLGKITVFGRALIKKPDLLDDILEETEELIKIFVTSIKTAEKK